MAKMAPQRSSTMRVLSMQRLDTGEICDAAFTLDGRSLYYGGLRGELAGYRNLCYALRDSHVPPEAGFAPISVWTIQVLWEIQQSLAMVGVRNRLIVHSGYRSPQTNASIESAARNSQHMYGRAVDFHVDGVPTDYLYRVARIQPYSGGVGYYPRNDGGWIHVDTWVRREWSG
jgi:uncharacterized protein YcbK (DUF882 family)